MSGFTPIAVVGTQSAGAAINIEDPFQTGFPTFLPLPSSFTTAFPGIQIRPAVPIGAIVGGVIGGLVFIGGIILALYLLRRPQVTGNEEDI
jgi:hypothetical protein